MRARTRIGIAAGALAVASCSGMAGDGHYTGPAGRVFPPDGEPAHSQPRLPSDGRASPGVPASDPPAYAAPRSPAVPQVAAPAPVASAPVPAAPAPAPAAVPSVPAPVSAAPVAAAPTTAPAASPRFAVAAPPTPAVIERPIYRAEGEKVGNDIDLRIERVWLENGFTFADLRVRNTSPYELEEITIKCTAFGKGHVNLDFREQTLLTRADGRMLPGFDKSLKIRLERAGFDVREMSCNAKGW